MKQLKKEEAIEILGEYLKDKSFRKIINKIIIYNLDVKTYQKLKEKEIIEMTFEQVVSGYKSEGIIIGEKNGKRETAKNLLSAGVPLEVIINAIKLLEQQIKEYIGFKK